MKLRILEQLAKVLALIGDRTRDQHITLNSQSVFSARTHCFTKPYTVLRMICRQNSTDLWKANHKLFSNTYFSASETHFTWSRNSDFLLKIASGAKDYRACFPKANVPPLSPWGSE